MLSNTQISEATLKYYRTFTDFTVYLEVTEINFPTPTVSQCPFPNCNI